MIILASLCLVVLFVVTPSDGSPGSPIILVPGYGGCQIDAKLDKPSVPDIYCDKKSDWYQLWLSMEDLVPFSVNCFVDNMRLVYNEETHTTSNSPGVQTFIPGFGNTSSVEWLDTTHYPDTDYFYEITQALVRQGYTRGRSIRGAPFDWRKAPNELQSYLGNLKMLIEETYKINGNSKVVLLGHSLGNNVITYFLYNQTQQWKDMFIKSYINMAGPLGGTAKTLLLLISGYNLKDPLVKPLIVRPMERSFPVTMWLMPDDTFWTSDDILVTTPQRSYTVQDYNQLFADMGYPTGMAIRQDVEPLIKGLKPPGVEVHCLHGVNVPTMGSFQYGQGDFPDSQPTIMADNGDGTVNLRSLLGCLKWRNQSQPLYHQTFNNMSHSGMLKDPGIINYISKVLYS